MFSIDNFIEIQVVGFLLLLAISPLLNLSTVAFRTKPGFCPLFDTIPDKSAKAILLLVFAFSIGIAGNRLVDELFDTLGIEGREEFEYQCPKEKPDCPRFFQYLCPENKIDCPEKYEYGYGKWWQEQKEKNNNKLKKLKLAEYYVSDHSEMARRYFERHKSFMRVLRGAAFASFLLLLTMAVYQLARKSKKLLPCNRYKSAHFITVIVFLLIFSFAYRFEAQHYYNRVYDLYKDYPFEKSENQENK
jgi:hypothetical protein